MKTLYVKHVTVRIKHVVRQFNSYFSKHNLESLLVNMPKSSTQAAALKAQRQKNKEKAAKYVPGTVSLQVLGSGANGAPRCLYVFTDQSRYMFNCGEGTQRLAHEHKMKLAKLEQIFFTHASWENIGGLPGISLTIQDVGVPEITIHGPEGIADMFLATRRFIILKDLAVKTADYNEQPFFEDNVMRVTYVPLKPEVQHSSRRSSSLDRSSEKYSERCDNSDDGASPCTTDAFTTDDETDYYAHERNGAFNDLQTNVEKKRRRYKKRSSSVTSEDGVKRRRVDAVGNVVMSYICKLHARPGALCLEACVEKGVPPGPLLGRLKAGEDITLGDGRVVKSSDVTMPDDPGPTFIVVECPNEKFLDPLVTNLQFVKHQNNLSSPDELAYLVVHFTPPHILESARYQEWMKKFPSSTKHLIINESNSCMGSIAVHRIQYKLNMLHPSVFPLLSDDGIPVLSTPHTNGTKLNVADVDNDSIVSSSPRNCSTTTQLTTPTSTGGLNIYQGRTFSIVQLRPKKHFDRANELVLNLEEYKKEVFQAEEMAIELPKLQQSLKDVHSRTHDKEYPYVLFLGTGSCIPNKTRNTSGILIKIGPDKCMLMDCGEGTYGQLVRFYGNADIEDIMSTLEVIFVSHLHADHHIGLIGLLKARIRYTSNKKKPLFLVAPKQIMTWLHYYNDHFEPILQQVELIPSGDIIYNNYMLSKNNRIRLCSSLDMTSVMTAPVRHCPNSFGIALKHESGWKITYSGDTMPSDALVELGKDSTLLIHEATMEDELVHEARRKMHSTTSEAIEIGKRMNSQFTLLTHFSQRYATLPRFNENIKEGIGIAFDNMKVRFSDLNNLPLMYPALKLMFSSHQEELEQKAFRRELRQSTRAQSRSPSTSRSESPSQKNKIFNV